MITKINPVEVTRKLYSEAQDLDALRAICIAAGPTVQMICKEQFHQAVDRITGARAVLAAQAHSPDFQAQRKAAIREEKAANKAKRKQRKLETAPVVTTKVAEAPFPECVMKRGGRMLRVWTKPLYDQMLKDGWKVVSNQSVSAKKG